jgi:hypothetical protein
MGEETQEEDAEDKDAEDEGVNNKRHHKFFFKPWIFAVGLAPSCESQGCCPILVGGRSCLPSTLLNWTF